ncbi:hypothetical protein BGZ61DRAFT_497756 [Ilyonectria robusta]|uniref:uncharacterized protein n=1 Tax=Ilyonectria robusta TaxID=1079257 RepID=UPI001E8D4569|nr:uncharacterized protein BGZ61DRAFT_497756 [Ilyonectria robusta]KAH8670626.1 hypothetical protein BGZ61DRAFT_497756 [Ilyonectria robusta]
MASLEASAEQPYYVTIGDAAYDVTEFLQSHPGGADLVLKYAGHDVTSILSTHLHTLTPKRLMKSSTSTLLAQSCRDGGCGKKAALSKETDFNHDYTTHKFLDLNRPLFSQVWFGSFSKDFYLDQVPFSLTPWWIVPTFWMLPVSYGVYISRSGLSSAVEQAGYLIFGFFLWSLIEYTLHRFLLHLDNYIAISLHFLLPGIHHYLPMDKYCLVMPPVVFIILASPSWKLAHFLHHRNLPLWYKQLKKYHLQHHFLDYELGFGVTTRFWDHVFGTEFYVAQKVK